MSVDKKVDNNNECKSIEELSEALKEASKCIYELKARVEYLENYIKTIDYNIQEIESAVFPNANDEYDDNFCEDIPVVNCPKCGAKFELVSTDDPDNLECPLCGTQFKIEFSDPE